MRILRADLTSVGLPTTYGPYAIDFHATRRSFVTWLGIAGVEEGTINLLMGHAGGNYGATALQNKPTPFLDDAVCPISFVAVKTLGSGPSTSSESVTKGVCSSMSTRTRGGTIARVLALLREGRTAEAADLLGKVL